MKLGGSLFVRNAIKYDYCIREAIASLCAAVDNAVIVDASSDDGTLQVLMSIAKEHSNLEVISGAEWECERSNYSGKDRLVQLANKAKSYVDCDWHFMLQADEVIHHASIEAIRSALESYGDTATSFLCTRVNVYGDIQHYVDERAPGNIKPCSDRIVRLGRKEQDAYGDAESIESGDKRIDTYENAIVIFHYGFVRRPDVMVDKIIDMQGWFGCGVDERALKLKEQGKGFDGREMIDSKWLRPLRHTHPTFAEQWVRERMDNKT